MKWFMANVEDVTSDPAQSGSVKIKIQGYQDKISEFRHAKPMFDVSNPINKKVGSSPTGLLKGSQVIGFFADDEGQVPIILGSIGSESGKKSQSESRSNIPNYSDGDSPLYSKDEKNSEGKSLGGKDVRYIHPSGNDYTDPAKGKLDSKSMILYAHNESPNIDKNPTITNLPEGIFSGSGSIGQSEVS